MIREDTQLNWITSLFFVSVIVIGNFFFLNLSIGVIIAKYNREKELFAKDLLLTEEQTKWVKYRMNILQSQPNFMMRAP